MPPLMRLVCSSIGSLFCRKYKIFGGLTPLKTRAFLLQKNFQFLRSRPETPTDNGSTKLFVGLFKLAITERRRYQTLVSLFIPLASK